MPWGLDGCTHSNEHEFAVTIIMVPEEYPSRRFDWSSLQVIENGIPSNLCPSCSCLLGRL